MNSWAARRRESAGDSRSGDKGSFARLFTAGIPVFNGRSLLRHNFDSVLNSAISCEVAINGRTSVCAITPAQAGVSRSTTLTMLTVHKVFRRAEIEHQQLRFGERLPSGQDPAFAFATS